MEFHVENLACARGGIAVVAGISFSLTAGQTLILRGPNGSGKSTVLRTIAGLQPPLSGRVGIPADAVAYAAHADGLKATLSVAENLHFWASVYGTGPIDAALGAYDLRALADRPAQNLSAGQKRRLGLARLLLTGRPLWALDEPTVSLDVASVALFVDALNQHLATGGMALIASHASLAIAAAELDLAPHQASGTATMGAFDEALS